LLALVFIASDHAKAITSVNGSNNNEFSARFNGQVFDELTGLPIPGATVVIQELNISLISDKEGRFHLSAIPLTEEIYPVTIVVNATGYGDWRMENVRLVSDDTLILKPRLGVKPNLITLPSPDTLRDEQLNLIDTDELAPLSIDPNENWTIPSTITVRITGSPECSPTISYTLEVIDFFYYAQHVLPNEWYYKYIDESLRAGAMAVKMYAWYWIDQGGKWSDADVFDSACDQYYRPEIEYESTNRAMEYTWNWLLTRDNDLIHTSYRDTFARCEKLGIPDCMGQVDSNIMAGEGYLWNQILQHFYTDTELTYLKNYPAGFSLRYNGLPGDTNENRVLITTTITGTEGLQLPVNVGSENFTIEWWMKSTLTDNVTSTMTMNCGANQDWIYGNIVLDRYLSGNNPGYGVSLIDGIPVFGITGSTITDSISLCASTPVANGGWHHVAVERRFSDGRIWIYVDGKFEATANGPDGDISYPFDITPTHPSEPYLSIGAWKLDDDHLVHPFFRGWIDELRFSNNLRYTKSFDVKEKVFVPDEHTVALYHFDSGLNNDILDESGATGGPSNGNRRYGGTENGPEWEPSDLFMYYDFIYNFPYIRNSTPAQ
jgi:hypothetical protein